MEATILTGVDLVYLPRFKNKLKNGRQMFLLRVFHQSEIANQEPVHLAGIFAAKEAVMKALDLPKDSWHDIQVDYKKSGAPRIHIFHYSLLATHYSLSISHDGNYVIAQFVCILK